MPDRPPFPIPENKTPETCCLCIQMPQDPTWKAVISGLLFQPAEWFNWQRDEDKSGKELAQYWRKIYEEIDWSIMSCCCNDIPLSRFTSEGHYQTSNDGGATWTDAPNQDPRNQAPQIPPALPPGTVVPECTYADSVVEFFKQGVIDVLTEGNTIQQVIALIGGILAAVFGAGGPVLGVIGALIAALAAGIVGLGITAVKDAFTDTVWTDLKCLLYKNINADGSFSQAQVDNIYANVPGNTVAQTVLRSWIAALGLTGLTNTARLLYGSPTADCSSCTDFCGADWVKLDPRLATPTYDPDAQTISGDATQIFASYYFAIGVDYPNCCITYVQLDSGGIDVKLASPCDYTGSLTLDESVGWTSYPLGIPTAPFRGVLLRSTVPFHVTISLTS